MKESAMSETLLQMAKDLVYAQVRVSNLSPEEMHIFLQDIYNCLYDLHAQEVSFGQGAVETPERLSTPPNWKKSITKHVVTCLICGATKKQLSVRHLRTHGLDTRSYRLRFRIPLNQSLAARKVTAKRKELAQKLRPWEKAPKYILKQGRAKQAAVKKTSLRTAPESESESVEGRPKRVSRKRAS
jgi:predicted transcriptional regulator